MKLNFIYCKNINNHIGFNSDLLYNIPDDMKYFKKITSQEYIKDNKNIVIMGYNTWISIPNKYKPLSDRINIVISNNHYNELKENKTPILIFKDFNECYNFLKKEEEKKLMLGEKFIIGGSQLYNYVYDNYLGFINKIYETHINHSCMNQLHYSNNLEDNYSKLNFNIQTNRIFKLINKMYCDNHEIKIINSETIIHGVNYNLYQNEKYINHDENQYLNLMKNILYKNNIKDSRNSKVISQFGEKMIFDLRKGFPLLTTKRMPFKTILKELLWFVKGSTSNTELNEKNVHI